MIDIGVDSLKIEGRSRSPFYSAAISLAYRQAIDAIIRGDDIPDFSYEIVNSIPSRGYTTALLEPHRPNETQEYDTNSPNPGKWQICGEIISQDENFCLTIEVKNRFFKNSKLMLFTPEGMLPLEITALINAKNNESMEVAPGTGYIVKIPYTHKLDLSTTVLLRVDD